MRFQYFKPRSDIRSIVSSYYNVTFPDPVSDKMRAEIANIRFVIRGQVAIDIDCQKNVYPAGTALLCGPTHKWSDVKLAGGTQVFGAAITPLGWARLLDVSANDLADQFVPLQLYLSKLSSGYLEPIFNASDEVARVEACDTLFASMVNKGKRIDVDFLDQITAWITSPEPNELADLFAQMQLSQRQIERLCKKYFGSPPKLLHRKFRALHSANRLTWQELTKWQDIATTAYSDQSHFIREFKQFNGRTPSEFIKGTHLLVRMTLEERLQIAHGSPFSLIG